jgi:hypothetical protein
LPDQVAANKKPAENDLLRWLFSITLRQLLDAKVSIASFATEIAKGEFWRATIHMQVRQVGVAQGAR